MVTAFASWNKSTVQRQTLHDTLTPMQWPGNGTLIATCLGGAEPYLENELRQSGMSPLLRENGAVTFSGGFDELVRANHRLRTASRILLPVVSGTVRTYDELYRLARKLDWTSLITPEQTLRVSAVTRSQEIQDSNFAAIRVKDAITDSQRARTRKRSTVARRDPDLAVTLFVNKHHVQISLDSSGRPLHERGYRKEAGEAPLRETLAATLLYAAEWQSGLPLFDPFCGSGTIAIEAALMAAGIYPGDLRSQFGYTSWEFARSEQKPEEATADRSPPTDLSIVASDIDPDMIEIARRNAERAGVGQLIDFRVSNALLVARPPVPGVVVTNPPYGERLDRERAGELMASFGHAAKENLPGWRVLFLSEGKTGAKAIGLRTRRVAELWNGGIQTNFYGADIYPPREPPADV
jgi:23S rRNA G2445 N2-methylase RlmL